MSHDTLPPLLVRWLTHDLATPIATMMTASELLSDTSADAEINGLIAAAARRLAARLRLIRAALAPGEAPMSGPSLQALLTSGLEGTSISFVTPLAEADGARAAVITGAALLLADVRRGEALGIGVAHVHWATPAPFSETVAAALAGEPATDSRSAVAAMLVRAATRAGVNLTASDDGICWA